MTSNADQPISALRTGHDHLVALVQSLPAEAITGPSGASEWTVAQVLSHLGSGAEIGLAGLKASLGESEKPAENFNRSVWDRWDAMDPEQQAHGFVQTNKALVERYESLDDEARTTSLIDLGFLPAPVDVATAAGFRLNEFTLHSWDVVVAGDPAATLAPDAVEPLLDIVPYLIGWLGRPGAILDGKQVSVAVNTRAPERHFGLEIGEKVTLTDTPADPDATLELPAESWLRLATGRLAPNHTPAAVAVSGAVTPDQLRSIFPGY